MLKENLQELYKYAQIELIVADAVLSLKELNDLIK